MIYKVDKSILLSLAQLESFTVSTNSSGEMFKLMYTHKGLLLKSPIPLPLEQLVSNDTEVFSEEHSSTDLVRSAASLKELIELPLNNSPDVPKKALVLFETEQAATSWILESIHLGKDRLKYLNIEQERLKHYICGESTSNASVFCITIENPSYFQLYNRNFCVFTEVFKNLWAPFEADLQALKRSLSDCSLHSRQALLLDGLTSLIELPEKDWKDIYTRLNPIIATNVQQAVLQKSVPAKIDVFLRFERIKHKKQPTAWLLLDKDIPEWHQLLNESTEMDLIEWSYLIGSVSKNDREQLPRLKSSSALLLLNKTGSSFPYTGIPLYQWLNSSNIFIPTHYQISPVLRQDTYYKIFNARPDITQVYLPSSEQSEEIVLQFVNQEHPLKDLIKHRMVAEQVQLEQFACSSSFTLEHWSSLPKIPKELHRHNVEESPPALSQTKIVEEITTKREKEPEQEPEQVFNLSQNNDVESLLDLQLDTKKQIERLLSEKPNLLKTIFNEPESSKSWQDLYDLYTNLHELYAQTQDLDHLDGQIRADILNSKLKRSAEQVLVLTPTSKIEEIQINRKHVPPISFEILSHSNPTDVELLKWQNALKNQSIGTTNILLWWKCWELIITKTSNIGLYKECCETIEQELRNTGLGSKEFPDELLIALKKVHLSSETTEQPVNAHAQLIALIEDPYWKGFCAYMIALLIDSNLLEGNSEEYLQIFLDLEQQILNADSDPRASVFKHDKVRQLLLDTYYKGLNQVSSQPPQDRIAHKWHTALKELQTAELEQFDQLMSETLNAMGKIFSIGSNLEEQTNFASIKERYFHHPNEAFNLLKQDLEFLKGRDLLGIPYIIGLREELNVLLLSELSEQVFNVLNSLIIWLGEQDDRGSKRWMLSIVLIIQPVSTTELLSSAFSNIEHYIYKQNGPVSFQISKFSKMLLGSVQLLPSEERPIYIGRLFKLLSTIDTGPKHMFSFLILALKALSTDILYVETQKSLFLKRAEIRLLKQVENLEQTLQ